MSKPTSLHTTGELNLPLTNIVIPQDRLRTSDQAHRDYIEHELCPSIAEHGLGQPIVVSVESEPIEGLNIYGMRISSIYKLGMGYSRLSAFRILEHDFIPANSRASIPEADYLMLELEENVRRKDMSWQDKTKAIVRVHQFHDTKAKSKVAKWSQRATGNLLNVSEATVNQALLVGKLLLANDKEICEAPNFDSAQKIMATRKLNAARAELAKRTIDHGTPSVVKPSTRASGPVTTLSEFDIQLPVSANRPKAQTKEKVSVPLSKMLLNRECVTVDGKGWAFEGKGNKYDLIFTDHPYGIDMDNLDLVTQDQVAGEHDQDENLRQMPWFLKGAYRQLKEDGYLIFFMDTSHHEKLKAWGKEAGFQVMPYEFIWCKTSSCKNRAANVWPTKATESVMIMRKGKATMFSTLQKNWFMDSGDAERKKYGHPFAKPFNLCKELLTPFILPGMRALDMYAGSGSMVCTMITLGLKVTAIEKKKEHFDKLVINVKDLYQLMLSDKEVEFV